ncbi:UDP-N-acetylglucosamine 2-epimerase [Pedobacter psychroterrae]|uniref:UDP-N-acetylglucosamine 2-epimerase (Hydrolyzing) n=1 Tax=Pedobacter psychroterrae TaxID=2530453 RepID=A0A4R0NPI7_9SPHI|nr:UDP-N-acetylglucosamine 2-epimerase [Pedobacter psychroterrae]TCD02706.1 UDP-N-acetylglucosamine 2-epimerase (hydrolyzing) [Pedobacter psychroterrae]
MKIGVLTSSRADYGIYLSLLKRLEQDPIFNLEIIAFGTHLSRYHGYTLDLIKQDGFKVIHEVSSLLTNDDESSISTAFGLTALKFADFWTVHQFDLVFCLGDRFEMAAAVQAGIPFGVKFAHLHGGETTLGAIDNVYRHQITLASKLHFPATSHFANRIKDLLGNADNIFTVGSLSIDELNEMPISSEEEFRSKYDIKGDFALLTFHPETVSPKENAQHADFVFEALHKISQKILLVITMPNADTFGTVYRSALLKLKSIAESRVVLVENFGKLNYFAAMRYSKLLIGNTSSGIIEAASFGKYVINVGDRQKGRAQSGNVFDIPFSTEKLTDLLDTILTRGDYTGENIYHMPGTVELIIDNLKKLRK